MEYNIIIPVAFKDYPFLKKTINYIEKNLSPDTIFIITNYDLSCCIPCSIRKHSHCVILDENELIPHLSYRRIDTILHRHTQVPVHIGWYYQQLLKIGFALSDYCNTAYYLSWDADTLPLCKIDFFTHDGHPFFTMKDEHHAPYFESINHLFGIKRYNKQSYIAEHMMFNKDIIADFISQIANSAVEGNTWFEKIINSTNPNEPYGFSEFETYGNFCYNKYPDLYKERLLSGFRYGGFISGRFINERILRTLSFDISTISFEIYHIPPFPWNIASWLYDKYLKKIKYREYQVKTLFKK